MTGLDKDQLTWPTTSEIFGALSSNMLLETPPHVGTNAGVQTAIVTLNDIDRPGRHRPFNQLICSANRSAAPQSAHRIRYRRSER